MFWKENWERRRWELGFTMDKSCRLYVPFYLLTHPTGGKVPDFSPYGNHGIIGGGPGPWPTPIIGGKELITNPYFEGNPPAGWTTANGMETWDKNGIYGRWIDDPASQAYIYQDIPVLENGQQYILRIASRPAAISNNFYIRLIGGSGDFLNITHSSASNSLAYIITGDGSPAQIRIGNPSSSVSSSRMLSVVSLRPLGGYESLGWSFDWIDDLITLPTYSQLGILGEHTYLAWIRHVCKGSWWVHGLGKLSTYGVIIDDSDSHIIVRIYEMDSEKEYSITPDRREPIRWSCYAYIYKPGYGSQFYIDGVPVTGLFTGISGNLKDGPAYIFNLAGARRAEGTRIGEIAVFSRAMSQDEIRNYYLQTRHRYN